MNKKRIPIRKRLFRMMLISTLGALLASSLISLICMLRIKSDSEEALSEHLQHNLLDLIEDKTEVADTRFDHYIAYVDFIADYIEEMYKGKDQLIASGQEINPPLTTTPKDTYAIQLGLNSEKIKLSALHDDILFFSNLDKSWAPIVERNDKLISTAYLGTKTGLLISYDKYSYLSAVPDGEVPIYDYQSSSWYKTGQTTKDAFLTGLYTDSQGRGLTITIARSFTDEKGRFAGVTAADFDITGLYDEIISMDIGNGAYSFAIDKNGEIISPYTKEKANSKPAGLSSKDLAHILDYKEGLMSSDESFFAYAPIEPTDWILCAYVPKSIIQDDIQETSRSIQLAMFVSLMIAILIILTAIFLTNRTTHTITAPIEQLGKDMEEISKGNLMHKATIVNNDELGDTAKRLNEMVRRLSQTKKELSNSIAHSQKMSELAHRDALTGIRNKTAYDREVQNLEWARTSGKLEFGIAMIDLNYLKRINDTFGHDRGNQAIIKLCYIICHVFSHSPVFRIGGDEFVVILKDQDYNERDKLIRMFQEKLDALAQDPDLEVWEKVSAAIGVALYEKNLDSSVQNVFKRADIRMYENKKLMKSARAD